jgi:hypothetical protein
MHISPAVLSMSGAAPGPPFAFTGFRAGTGFLNLVAQPAERKMVLGGRVIFYHSDVNSLYARGGFVN